MTTQRPYQGYQGYPYVNPTVTEVPTTSAVNAPNEKSSKPTLRPYQGYPYVNPSVIDVPTISADDAAKWNNLPRRPIDLNWRRNAAADSPEGRKASDPVVVYIDLPEDGASSVTERLDSEGHDFEMIESPGTSTDKRESDAPVVYIDLPEPEPSGSDVAQTPVTPEEPTFVQDTIYYDQFDNRRIDRSKDGEEESDDESVGRPARRPNVLDLGGGSGAGPSTAHQPLNVPALMSKQTDIYNCPAFETIPASQFPEPPPAYEEIQTPVVEQPAPASTPRPDRPPRTQVILPGDYQPYQSDQPTVSTTPMGMPNPGRKYLTCQHCGTRVHTLVIRESGCFTHTLALSLLLICLLPLVLFIYCTDYLKEKNHYCPNCNQLIGYQRPLFGSRIHYSTGHSP